MSSCAICLEPELNSPAACVPCGHTFCLACITQWTRSPPRFGLSLCPQCRSPVREVQKLFISDWPVSGGGSGGLSSPSQLSTWQQFHHLMTLLVHFLAIPFHSLVSYGPVPSDKVRFIVEGHNLSQEPDFRQSHDDSLPEESDSPQKHGSDIADSHTELARRASVWLNQQAERLVALRARLIQCAVMCRREWQDLGRQAQCFVGAAVLLVVLLLAQDLQDQDGIHRGIVLPILVLLLDMVRQVAYTGAYLVYRPLSCLLACVLEVGTAALDVAYVVVSSLLRVVWDVLCVPWLAVCVAARLLGWLLSLLAGMVQVCMFCVVLTLSLGLPVFLAAPHNPALHRQLPELLQAGIEWLRQFLLHHAQHFTAANPPQQQQQQQQQRQRPPQAPREQYRGFIREFLILLAEELRNVGRGEGERRGRNPEGERRGEGEQEGRREAPPVQEREGEGAEGGVGQDQGWSPPGSSLEVGETLEVR